MPKYLFQASYTQEGLKGLINEGGTRRREVVENLVAEMGGSVESFYYAFGDSDVYVVAELPDDAAAAASVAVGSSGSVSVKTTVLVTAETIDEAVKKTVSYRPPAS